MLRLFARNVLPHFSQPLNIPQRVNFGLRSAVSSGRTHLPRRLCRAREGEGGGAGEVEHWNEF